ncbi:MAG: SprB repeat-containing protein, partial [Bacteroidetes bacterium]|nr:SprB repeat-containing protein [Bacteroidota bacterium]
MKNNYVEVTENINVFSVLCSKFWLRCWRLWLFLPLFIVAFLMVDYTSTAQTGNVQGVIPVISPAGGFGVDGDAFADTPPPDYLPVGDWFGDPENSTTNGLFKIETDGSFTFNYEYMYFFQDSLSGDPDSTTFLSSNKINDHPNTYSVGVGNVPNKNEIQNVGVHFTYGTGPNDLWCIFAADREVTNGSSYIDFEFLQKSLMMEDDGTFTTEGNEGGRSIIAGRGDILVTVEFTRGGVAANVIVNEWTAVGDGYEYVPQPIGDFTGDIFATVNTSLTYVPFPAYDQYDETEEKWYYNANQWAEGAVNLTALFDLNNNPCFTLSTLFVRTRTSGSSSKSELKDLPGPPLQIGITIKPELELASSPVDCFDEATGSITATAYGDHPDFIYELIPGTSLTSAGSVTFNNLSAGTYQVVATDDLGCGSDTVDIEITEPLLLECEIISSTDVTFHGGANGLIDLSVSGGTAPYTY